ncbi:hypothetical protein [Agrobacterium sp. M50-1]|uniref:hypothetical protein n=1 Tax=Agrobacterium sp. M50-1 TaxID=3132821 RepID=UPI003CE4E02B
MNTGERPIPGVLYGDELPEVHAEMDAFDQLSPRVRKELANMPYDCDALEIFRASNLGVDDLSIILELRTIARDAVHAAYVDRGVING